MKHGHAVPEYRVFRGEPGDLRSISGIVSDARSLGGRGLIQLGLLLLIATPIARVVFSVVGLPQTAKLDVCGDRPGCAPAARLQPDERVRKHRIGSHRSRDAGHRRPRAVRGQVTGSGCYTCSVRRFALTLIVALLTFTASGVAALAIPEPCTGFEQSGQDDGACPPMCVTCGCCAQAAEPVGVSVARAPEVPLADITLVIPRLPKASPHDILHVPKLPFA